MAHVLVTRRIRAPATKVWDRVGAFSSLGEWNPAVRRQELSGTGPGSIRTLYLDGEAVVTEELLQEDPATRTYVYTILSSPLPVKNYRATFAVHADDGATCAICWSVTFEPAGASEAEAIRIIETIFSDGLSVLQQQFGL